MNWNGLHRGTIIAGALIATICSPTTSCFGQLNTGAPQVLSTGQRITPLAPNGASYVQLNPGLAQAPTYTVGQAVTTVVSPDHKTLLILTSGYNLWAYGSPTSGSTSEFVFVFDISGGAAVQKQAIPVPNTYSGIAFNPNGQEFYISGGDNDNVHFYSLVNGKWMEESSSPIALGHLSKANPATGNFGGLGLEVPPEAAGIAVTQNGTKLVVADYENDAISVLSAGQSGWSKTGELDLRPGIEDPATASGVPGGEFPYWVCIKGNDTAYISSIRDRQIVVVNISAAPVVTDRIQLPGQPNRMVLNAAQSRLYVAQDNSDSVAVIDTGSNSVLDEIKVTAPVSVYPNKEGYKGANPNDVALSPDEKTLYVTNGGENAVAVVQLSDVAGNSYVSGLIPTGFYPNSVSTSSDGKLLYIVNGKSANGPNPGFCDTSVTTPQTIPCLISNQYDLQLTKAGFQTVTTPTSAELSKLTEDVIANDHFRRTLTQDQEETIDALHHKIRHVIYIIKENRTYDQVLGDLEVGNGDPSIVQFPEANTPNFHAFARNFVDLDNFYDTSNVSFDGWAWSTSARTTDVVEKEYTVNYANRGLSYDSEGTNRNINVGYGNLAEREAADPLIGNDPNLLPGDGNVAAPDSADGDHGEGYLWNAALKAGLSVRNYGFFLDLARYNLPAPYTSLSIPEDITPYADKVQVAYSANKVLQKYTDQYFRGFDNVFPDYYRVAEWQREFNQYASNGDLPNLTLLRLMHDHFGNFGTALNGVNTPELEIADNDYAVGLVAETVAHSRYKDDTLIFVIEDDSQDGGDHVDAHRSTAFIIGPYVKQKSVDSTPYDTVSMVRTIEDILDIKHLNLNDASALPMVNAFDMDQKQWNYTATPSTYLKQTTLPIDPSKFTETALENWHPLHNASWWAQQTKGMDFSVEDHVDTAKFNRILWEGIMGSRPYPTQRTGLDLRTNRTQLLKNFRQAQQQSQPGEAFGSASQRGAGNMPPASAN